MNKRIISIISSVAFFCIMAAPISVKSATLRPRMKVYPSSMFNLGGTKTLQPKIRTNQGSLGGTITIGRINTVTPSSINGKVSLTRYSSSISLGDVRLTSASKIRLQMPNDSRKDLMQGTIVLSPIGSGSRKSYDFMNFYNENWNIDLADLSSGLYTVTLNPTVYGTSDRANFYYTIG